MFDKLALYVTIGLTALSLVLGISLWGSKKEMANLKLTYANAQKEAEIASYKKVKEVEEKYDEERRKQDRAYTSLNNEYRATVLRKYSQSKAGTFDMPGAPGTSGGPIGDSEGSIFSISLEDALTCGDNTAKAQIAHEWVMGLQKK